MLMDNGHFELARTEFETALQIYPSDPHTLATYGVLEARQGNYQEAGRKIEKAFSMISRDNLFYDEIAVNLAAIYAQTDHMDSALDLLNREVAEAPEYGPAWANRAFLHYQRGETAAARADIKTALNLDPTNRQVQDLMQRIASAN
jgi:tetratricopeptide (TPR) repeat protein